jgi:hypothetical protein
MIKFDEFNKVDLRVGEVAEVSKGSIKINCSGKSFITKMNLNVKKGEQIIIGFNAENLVVPIMGMDNPLIPEKKAGEGWKIQ